MIGLGCWQLGGDWGTVGDDEALGVLHAAVDAGVTFLDTADVYGDGRSETLIGRFLRERARDGLTVATKAGRRRGPARPRGVHGREPAAPGPTGAGATSASTRSTSCSCTARRRRSTPRTPSSTRSTPSWRGAIAAYGVSVETVDEALTAIARPNVATVQIILNAFRLKPLDRVLPAAREAGVGIIARVPLASGLLSGKYDEHTTFAADDHRTYNRHGEAFDVGETFSGVPFEVGVQAAKEIAARARRTRPPPRSPSLDRRPARRERRHPRRPQRGAGPGQCGGRRAAAAERRAAGARPAVYDERIREHVQDRW